MVTYQVRKLNALTLAGKEKTVEAERRRVKLANAKTRAAKAATAERMSKAGLKGGARSTGSESK